MVFGVIAAVLGAVLLWGLLSPRSLWRIIEGWSVVDAHRHEPGGGSYVIRRLLCLLGLVGIVAVWGGAELAQMSHSARTVAAPNAVERMWGGPEPHIVNRVVDPLAQPPAELTEARVLGYQVIDTDEGPPRYLIDIVRYSRLGDPAPEGIIGAYPGDGYTAMSTAHLLVHVRGPILCIPREAVVIETADAVQVAVYFGLPDPAEGTVDHLAGCPADSGLTESLLIPIRLAEPLEEREVVTLTGERIDRVQVVG
jgi:hypothetical protein